MKLLLILSLLCSPTALAQSASDKARVAKKAPAQPTARMSEGAQQKALRKAGESEKRKHDALSKASRERHKSAPNAIRNER